MAFQGRELTFQTLKCCSLHLLARSEPVSSAQRIAALRRWPARCITI
jgi:hypothetical protein